MKGMTAMRKYIFHLLSALVLMTGAVSCDKVTEAILEEEDDGLHRGYSVELYEPEMETDLSYTLTAKFSDMERFRYNKMRAGFYIVKSDYTPYHPTAETAGEPYETQDWVVENDDYKWVDEIADDGTYSFNFSPIGNQQYTCKACVLEELSDGRLQVINSEPFCVRGTTPIELVLTDTLSVRFEIHINGEWVNTRTLGGSGICWSSEGVPTMEDNYTPYQSYSFNFGDCETVYLRGFLAYENGAVDYSNVIEYHPQEWTYYVRTREDLAHLAGTEYENFRGTIVFEIDMLEEEKKLLNTYFNCYVEGNGHSLYFGSVGPYGHVDNVRILYSYPWELKNHGIITNCYIDGNNHLINMPEGYIGQCSGWINENQGLIEDCHEITIASNYGVVRNCVNSYSFIYDKNLAPYNCEYIVMTNTKYGIIEGCSQSYPYYFVYGSNEGIVR